MNNIVITELADMRRWDGALLAMRMALKNGYEGVYRIASDTLHEVAAKYDQRNKPLIDILLGL